MSKRTDAARADMQEFSKQFSIASAKQDFDAIQTILEKMAERVLDAETKLEESESALLVANETLAGVGAAKAGALPPEVIAMARAKQSVGMDWTDAVKVALNQFEHDKALAKNKPVVKK